MNIEVKLFYLFFLKIVSHQLCSWKFKGNIQTQKQSWQRHTFVAPFHSHFVARKQPRSKCITLPALRFTISRKSASQSFILYVLRPLTTFRFNSDEDTQFNQVVQCLINEWQTHCSLCHTFRATTPPARRCCCEESSCIIHVCSQQMLCLHLQGWWHQAEASSIPQEEQEECMSKCSFLKVGPKARLSPTLVAPLWGRWCVLARLKYVNNYWLVCRDIWRRHSWSSDDAAL